MGPGQKKNIADKSPRIRTPRAKRPADKISEDKKPKRTYNCNTVYNINLLLKVWYFTKFKITSSEEILRNLH